MTERTPDNGEQGIEAAALRTERHMLEARIREIDAQLAEIDPNHDKTIAEILLPDQEASIPPRQSVVGMVDELLGDDPFLK